jgi:tRNA-specific 2-thiouridylase
MPMKTLGKKVFVGLSGGVDSSVSAYLLKGQGYDVTGVFIKVWQPDFVNCTFEEDRLDAMRVSAHLHIPFVTLDLEEEYKKGVIDYMLAEYKTGRTPNPDVMCNKEVKFGAFFLWAKKQGADYIATGHYAENIFNKKAGCYELRRSLDASKDQSYFLWTLSQDILKQTLFPVGHLKKVTVRKIAEKAGLSTASKKDSQGLCFISNVDMKDFLKHFLQSSQGDVLNKEGKVIGFHDGAIFLTLGERHGFTVTKKTPHERAYYVVAKNIENNSITVSHSLNSFKVKKSPGVLRLKNINFIAKDPPRQEFSYEAESRYHGPKAKSKIRSYDKEKKELEIELLEPLIAPPGQSLVLFDKNVCLGGGVIV